MAMNQRLGVQRQTLSKVIVFLVYFFRQRARAPRTRARCERVHGETGCKRIDIIHILQSTSASKRKAKPEFVLSLR
jgi:hypothetical protein